MEAMKASELQPGQFFEYTTCIDVRRCLCLLQDEIDTWIFDKQDLRTYRIASTTAVQLSTEQCWPCEHLWEAIDDSKYDQCLECGLTRLYEQPMFGDEVL